MYRYFMMKGFFLGDISSENVLVDPETNLVSFVDLEQSVFLEDHSKIAFFCTY